jgi:hypothetical protein
MPEISPEEQDALLADEAEQLMNEFQTELVDGSISRMRIYLSITIEKHYVLGIDFSNYPSKAPLVTLQEDVKKITGDPSTLETMKNWDPQKPPHIIDVIREIEGKLYDVNKYWEPKRMISGEFSTSSVAGDSNKLLIRILTYGWKEYPFTIIFRDPPNRPEFEFPAEIQQIVGPLENIPIYKDWDPSQYQINDLLREINWKIDKHSRLGFEVEILEGALKNVSYDPAARKITAEVKGVLKTSDVNFQFAITLPDDYPANRPNIALLTKVEDDALAKQMQDTVGSMLESWSPFNFLIDLFNEISKSIFNASVIVCIVCHSLKCPTCGKQISVFEGGDEACTSECPHCKKPYHAHCWQKNIESIGKCAYCLRPPPSFGAPAPTPESSDEDQSEPDD